MKNLLQKFSKHFIVIIFGTFFLFSAFFVQTAFAQTCPASANNKSSCEAIGGSWGGSGPCSCLPVGVQGSLCSISVNNCQQGLTCIPLGSGGATCQLPPPVLNPTTQTNPLQNLPTATLAPPSESKIGCNNDPNLRYSNGLCLPKEAVDCNTDGLSCTSTLTEGLVKLIKLLLTLSGMISVLFLIVGGFWYMTSAGNEEQAEKGKNTITNFFLGLVIIIMAYSLVTIVNNLLTQGK